MKILLSVLFATTTLLSAAQQKGNRIFLFKYDWTPAVNYDQATFFMEAQKENDTAWVCRYYEKNGPMLRWETYLDSALDIPNGRFAWYDVNGRLDTVGMVKRGIKDGRWDCGFIGDSGKVKVVAVYRNGRLYKTIDNINRTIKEENGDMYPFSDPRAIEETGRSFLHYPDERPAEFPGGTSAWNHFLSKHLTMPDKFLNQAYNGKKAPVGVQFNIDSTGKVYDPFIYRSCEWSIDSESLRVIRLSPNWQPAFRDGHTVLYSHRQSFTFSVGN